MEALVQSVRPSGKFTPSHGDPALDDEAISHLDGSGSDRQDRSDLALAVDRTWHVRGRTEPLYRYTVTSWHDGTIRTFSLDGVTLRFNSLAIARRFPEMYDCYALNVAPTADTYAYYYGESAERYFPLVHPRDGQVADVWQITTVHGALSVAGGTTHALFGGAYRHPERLALVDLATGETEDILAVDQDGQPIITAANEGRPLASVLI